MRGEVPRLPAVPHQFDVGVVALAGRLRAACAAAAPRPPASRAAPRPASHALLSTRQVVRLLKLYYFLAAEHLQQHAPLTIALTPSLTLTMTLTLTLATDPYPGPHQALLGRQRLLGVVPADRLLLRDR